jgi:hypothetical protein
MDEVSIADKSSPDKLSQLCQLDAITVLQYTEAHSTNNPRDLNGIDRSLKVWELRKKKNNRSILSLSYVNESFSKVAQFLTRQVGSATGDSRPDRLRCSPHGKQDRGEFPDIHSFVVLKRSSRRVALQHSNDRTCCALRAPRIAALSQDADKTDQHDSRLSSLFHSPGTMLMKRAAGATKISFDESGCLVGYHRSNLLAGIDDRAHSAEHVQPEMALGPRFAATQPTDAPQMDQVKPTSARKDSFPTFDVNRVRHKDKCLH